MHFQIVKLNLEKAEEPEIKLSTSVGSSKKLESSRKISTSAILASGPFTSWQTDEEKVEAVTDFTFLGSKITVDGD